MSRFDTRMYGPNRFKLGIFAMNCSNGMSMTKAPERWDHSWDNNVVAARLADEAGIEFLLPIGRWHGYRGETDTEGSSFETLAWASGLLAATKEITVCGTLHISFINPVFAAKQIVTADHIGKGRFALNIVSGWNEGEFGMFGIPLLNHDIRYDYTEEWVTIAKKIWTQDKPFDFKGQWFDLKGVLGKPQPWGGTTPMLISAGNSKEGRGFATRHVDCLFTAIMGLDTLADEIAAVQEMARSVDRQFAIFASGHMMARPTRKEAEEFYHYIVYEQGDWEAAEHAARIRTRGRETPFNQLQKLKERLISGVGTYPVVGSYDDCAETFKRMADAGLGGMAIGLVNYITEFPHLRDGVLPRLERLGLRLPNRQGLAA
jgi:alkanesulfonate monooxygenase SsuD/methylene tetrahydromethanopterin reductase-like flavin-dependent oxidoreductase (luciferase family)